MVYWGVDKSRAQSRAKPGRLWARSQAPTRTAAQQLPAQPRTALPTSTATTSRLLWPSYGTSSCTTTRDMTKRKQRKIESKSRKDERGYLFRLPGTGIFTNKDARNKGIIFTNRDARKYIEMYV
jgi:hypothetical protein